MISVVRWFSVFFFQRKQPRSKKKMYGYFCSEEDARAGIEVWMQRHWPDVQPLPGRAEYVNWHIHFEGNDDDHDDDVPLLP